MGDESSCAHCGLALKEGWRACPNCGRLIDSEAHGKRSLLIGLGALIGGLALLVFGVILATHTKTTVVHTASSASPSRASSPSRNATATAVESPGATGAIHLKGTGTAPSARFTVSGGLTVFNATCACTKAFSVVLVDERGTTQGGIFSGASGRFVGSVGRAVAAGAYTLKVAADGAWAVNVTQPRSRSARSLPQSYAGHGSTFVGPFAASGSAKVTASNTGAGNFVVQILAADGTIQDVPLNKVGNFKGSAVANGLSGAVFYMNVTSDGTWSVALSPS